MRTQVFSYKGIIGIKSNIKAEGLLNKPTEKGQLGFVVDAKYVDISPEALNLLKHIKRSSDDIGEVDVFQSSQGKVIFAWLGGPWKYLNPNHEEVTGSNTYDASLLHANNNVEIPKDFKAFVDKNLDK